jgi:type VI secretion system FHA domain protein
MALRLEIISHHRQQLGNRASIVLGVAGGSIGRALDNDWALPDTQRYLSGHHARIHFRQGGYYLEDTSTNGVYVNDSTTPQGRRGLYALRSGDQLRMGEYRVQVQVDDRTTPPRCLHREPTRWRRWPSTTWCHCARSPPTPIWVPR